MKTMKKSPTFRIFRKALILTVLSLAGCVLLLMENPVEASGSACFEAYDACHTSCDNQTPPLTGAALASCHSSCMGPYGNCVNQAQLNKEGQIISGYEYGQPMPVLQDLHMCLNNCPTCLITDYTNDPEGMQACLETRLACKIICIDSY